jgi:putative membrane protein
MSGHQDHSAAALGGTMILAAALVAGAILYLLAVQRIRRRNQPWPARRTGLWLLGLVAAAAPLAGPIAEQAHADFRTHMIGHVLLGMLAPLLMVLAAPVTLALRALPVNRARVLARALRSSPVVILTHPVTAALLSIGGLWLLYRTGLYNASTQEPLLRVAVHAHVLLAGYLFTFSLVGPDPAPHRPGLGVRAGVLVLAVAAHNILAKLLYAEPPAGVAPDQAATAAQIMYYAGAPIELALFILVGMEWLARDRRDQTRTPSAVAA